MLSEIYELRTNNYELSSIMNLSKNILATVIYYDGLGYPLTAFEIWKYMIRTDYYANSGEQFVVALFDVMKELKENKLSNYIENQNGFYFLKGQEHLVKKRINGGKISAGKFKRLIRVAKWLKYIPFVKMIGVTGAVAMKNAKIKSDLDLFVVFKSGKIWTGRTLVTLFLQFIGKRRHGKKVSDRVCLNFFVTDESLEINMKDLYSASEYMFLFPLFGFETYERFQIRNQWIRSMKPAYAISEVQPLKIIRDSVFSKAMRKIGEVVFSSRWIEQWLKKIERKHIMQNPKTHQEGSLIYANDDALVFLPQPHGPILFEKFKEKVEHLSV